MRNMWACGLTTVPERREVLLPQTLASLEVAGFPKPRLFVDCEMHKDYILGGYAPFMLQGYDITFRVPRIQAFGNWFLGAMEIFIRQPAADYYAMFQDDVVFCKNVRQYLEKRPWPSETSYLNLYTANRDQLSIEKQPKGWCEGSELESGHDFMDLRTKTIRRQQAGPGALALVFTRAGLLTLIQHQHMVERPMDVIRGRSNIDGGIVNAMNKAGWRVWVHNPSLCQHKGNQSTISGVYHPPSLSFPGEVVDALDML